jgi:hypothetical protein
MTVLIFGLNKILMLIFKVCNQRQHLRNLLKDNVYGYDLRIRIKTMIKGYGLRKLFVNNV